MYMKAAKRYSIAEARQSLPRLVDEAAAGRPIEITRRGKPVAAVVPMEEYARLRGSEPDLWERILKFRSEMGGEDLTVDLRGVRSRERGRRVRL